MTKSQLIKLVDYLANIESDLSAITNNNKAALKAFQRIIDKCHQAADLLETLKEDWPV